MKGAGGFSTCQASGYAQCIFGNLTANSGVNIGRDLSIMRSNIKLFISNFRGSQFCTLLLTSVDFIYRRRPHTVRDVDEMSSLLLLSVRLARVQSAVLIALICRVSFSPLFVIPVRLKLCGLLFLCVLLVGCKMFV